MISKTNSLIGFLIVVAFALLLFNINSCGYNKIRNKEIKDLKFERDSIVSFKDAESKARETRHKIFADSLIGYTKVYIKADSINKITIRNEKAKLRLLTRDGRDHVRDSIFRANGL